MAEYTGFRADLWRRIDQWVFSHRISSLDDIQSIDLDGIWLVTGRLYPWLSLGVDEASVRAIFNRWRAYQRVLAEDVLWRDGSDERAERLVAAFPVEGERVVLRWAGSR